MHPEIKITPAYEAISLSVLKEVKEYIAKHNDFKSWEQAPIAEQVRMIDPVAEMHARVMIARYLNRVETKNRCEIDPDDFSLSLKVPYLDVSNELYR